MRKRYPAVVLLGLFLTGVLSSAYAQGQTLLGKPQDRELDFLFRASDIHLESSTAELHVWVAEPSKGIGQADSIREDCYPPPKEIYLDPEYNNRILYFDLSPLLTEGGTVTISRWYRRTGWTVKFDPSEPLTWKTVELDPESVKRYTQSERWLEQTPEIRKIAKEATAGAEDRWSQVQALVSWVRDWCEYEYPPPTGRGALKMLEARRGDCGQYACLFIALARSLGIPSRFNAGLPINPETGEMGAHAWAEFWMPGGGWVIADPTHPVEELGTLSAESVVMTRGLNIPIPRVPGWANYDNSEVIAGAPGEAGRTEFIQNACVAARGILAKYSTQRRASAVIGDRDLDLEKYLKPEIPPSEEK